MSAFVWTLSSCSSKLECSDFGATRMYMYTEIVLGELISNLSADLSSCFQAATIYVRLETEELHKASENVSKATKSRRESQKQDVCGLVKCVIRAADRGTGH